MPIKTLSFSDLQTSPLPCPTYSLPIDLPSPTRTPSPSLTVVFSTKESEPMDMESTTTIPLPDPRDEDICKLWQAIAQKLGEKISLPLNIHNFDQWLDARWAQLQTISALYLNNHGLTHIPSQISKLSGLEHLELSQNQLTELPESFDKLTALKTLLLGHNQLQSIPKSILGLSLTTLFVNHNSLTSLEEVKKLKNLISFSAEGNPLVSCFTLPPNLQEIYLGSNYLVNGAVFYKKVPSLLSRSTTK